MLEVTTILKTEGFLLTVNMEKAFDSIDHLFKFHVFRKLGFGKNFIKWIKFILTNQEPCIINGGKTSKYFRLKKGRRQRDPTSAYLFILVLEVVFAVTKSNKTNGLKIFEYEFLYTAYGDDTTFFLENQESVIEILNVFDRFSKVSGLKPNTSKREIARIGGLKQAKVALCGMQCINLKKESLKILGTNLLYDKKLEQEKILEVKIENALKSWKMRDLSI